MSDLTQHAGDPVLVVNAGSSSLKYELLAAGDGTRMARGAVERIGEDGGAQAEAWHETSRSRHETSDACADHHAAMDIALRAFATHGPRLEQAGLVGVVHRVVHGGDRFVDPVVIDPDVLAAIEALVPLAPLHNPANLDGIRAAQAALPDLTHVAVFDTAFHHTLPAAASTFAVPRPWRQQWGVRRYGFHGPSHAYVARRTAALLGRDPADCKLVVLHLGNGASACAVDGGRSVDTSMGLSPLDGLVMGTRPGWLDPAVAGHLARLAGMSIDEFDHALAHDCGLQGLCGHNDFRAVMDACRDGDPDADLAVEIVVHRLVGVTGAYAATLGRLDAIAFTAGIGEHAADLRAAVLDRLGIFGVELDVAANAAASGETRITTTKSAVAAYVVPTNEAWEMARSALTVLTR